MWAKCSMHTIKGQESRSPLYRVSILVLRLQFCCNSILLLCSNRSTLCYQANIGDFTSNGLILKMIDSESVSWENGEKSSLGAVKKTAERGNNQGTARRRLPYTCWRRGLRVFNYGVYWIYSKQMYVRETRTWFMIGKPERKWSFGGQAEVCVKPIWRAEPMNVAKFSDDLPKGVKSESNFQLAGSRRNISKYGVVCRNDRGKALFERVGSQGLRRANKLWILLLSNCSQAAGAKLRMPRGKQPVWAYKVPNFKLSFKKSGMTGNTLSVSLESATR